jgi:hypothetical protein
MSFFDRFSQSLDKDNHLSPFGEAGLLGDPLHYIGGDKYDNFMRKTWETPNEVVGNGITKFDTYDRKVNPIHRAMDRTEIGGKIKDFVHNKPGDSAMAILGSIYGGGALMSGGGASGGSGMFGNMFGGGGTGQGLGIFSNGGTGGMSQVGVGNAGVLAQSGGIGGGAGMGAAGTSAGPAQIGLSGNWQQYMKAGQSLPGMNGQQQQQDTGPKPYLYRGQVIWM